MDGVISDTQKLHSKVESELLSRYGVDITPAEITKKYSGVKTKEFFDDVLKKQKQKYDLEPLLEEKWLKMSELAKKSVDSIQGARELVEELSVNNYKLAVASASNSNYVNTVLRKLEMKDYFLAVVSGDMVEKGKPNPESFLLASSMLNVAPENCLVIEDGTSGMEAAKLAGMKCIGLVEDKRRKYPTSNLVNSLSEITLDYIKGGNLL